MRKLKIAYLQALQRGDKEQAESIKKEIDGKVVIITTFTDFIKNHNRMQSDKETEFRYAKNNPFTNFLKSIEQ